MKSELQDLAMPTRCPACESEQFTRIGTVAVRDLARAWATDRAVGETRGYPLAPGRLDELTDNWEARIVAAIGSASVAFDQCRECGLEISSPCKCWPEGSYTEDENYPVRWEFGRFLEDLGSEPRRVLELGAGRGTFLGLASARGHKTLGVDFNPNAVAFARGRGLEVINGGFDQLRQHLADRPHVTFDAVAMFHVIEHLPDPTAVLRGLNEFVRPGALLGISCPGPRRFSRMIGVQQVGGRDFWDHPPHHVLRWNPEAMRILLGRIGWEVVTTVEEPLVVRDAAAQVGVTRALWTGYHHRPLWRKAGILAARVRVLAGAAVRPTRGLSLYTLARYRGGRRI